MPKIILMHELMNNAYVKTMHKQNKIKSMHKIIEWAKHEMHKHVRHTDFKQTIHLGKEIITNM